MASHAEPGTLVAQRAQRGVGEPYGVADALGGDQVDGFAQGDVRRHAEGAEFGDDVHLSEEARVTGQFREHLVLVVEFPAAGVQRALVEGREADAVEPARQREVDHDLERFPGQPAGLGGLRAARDRHRVDVAEVDHGQRLGRPAHFVHAGIGPVGEPDARVAHAELQHARISDHDHAGDRVQGARGEQLGGDLRADAGHVAQHESDNGFFHVNAPCGRAGARPCR